MNRGKPGKKKQCGLLHTLCQRTTSTNSGILLITANNGIRMKRSLSQKGFELASGLPFIATDPAIHHLLDSHCVAEAERLQIALSKLGTLPSFLKEREKLFYKLK
jgi:hypothetical protein